MPGHSHGSMSVKDRYAFRKALKAYFTGRGIPDYRHRELEFRWIKQKGYRLPNV